MKKINRKGFTIAELLIVVAIIAVLVAIAIPVFTNALDNAKRQAEAANARSVYAEATAAYLENTASTSLTKTLNDGKTYSASVGTTGGEVSVGGDDVKQATYTWS